MGRLVVNNAMTVNGAFEAPSPRSGSSWTPTATRTSTRGP
jgi:hypothetical protein